MFSPANRLLRLATACLLFAACVTHRTDVTTNSADPDTARAATLALLEYVAEAFPGTWGTPAEVYCVDAPHVEEAGWGALAARVRPAAECRWEPRPGAPVTEQRVRHSSTGRSAVIYTFGPVQRTSGGRMLLDFTWFGAYHFSGGYRCTLARDGAAWRVTGCEQTMDYRGVGE